MLDSDQIITLILLGILAVYMWVNHLLDKRETEGFQSGYKRGFKDGRLVRSRAK